MRLVGDLHSSLSCLCSWSALVRTVANYGILTRSHSFIGRNVMFLCNHFHFSAADFKFGQASHLSNTISRHHLDTVCVLCSTVFRLDALAKALSVIATAIVRANAFVILLNAFGT